MHYVIIPCAVVNGPDYVRSKPGQRQAWLNLVVYCAVQEGTRGVIRNCRDWNNRTWEQIAHVTRREIHTPNKLYWFEGDDLIVTNYCQKAEDSMLKNREAKRQARLKAKRKGNGAQSRGECLEEFLDAQSEVLEEMGDSSRASTDGPDHIEKGIRNREQGIEIRGEGVKSAAPRIPEEPEKH